jgi:hypothetical protein
MSVIVVTMLENLVVLGASSILCPRLTTRDALLSLALDGAQLSLLNGGSH